jgi:hypothetical protein
LKVTMETACVLSFTLGNCVCFTLGNCVCTVFYSCVSSVFSRWYSGIALWGAPFS